MSGPRMGNQVWVSLVWGQEFSTKTGPWILQFGQFSPRGDSWHVVQLLSHVWPLKTPWTAARQASLSFTVSQSLLKLKSIESVMPSNHLILCLPFSSCLQSFPASGAFLMGLLFSSGCLSTGVSASASVLPINIQGQFPLGLTGLISLQSKELSIVFSRTVWKYQFFGPQPSLRSNAQNTLRMPLRFRMPGFKSCTTQLHGWPTRLSLQSSLPL